MENPATWTKVEHVINKALQQAEESHKHGNFGWSTARRISFNLREEGLLISETVTEFPTTPGSVVVASMQGYAAFIWFLLEDGVWIGEHGRIQPAEKLRLNNVLIDASGLTDEDMYPE